LKSKVAQHDNLAAKGIFGVRVPLRFFFSFRLNKNNTRDFFTDQELDKFRRFFYTIYHHNLFGNYFNNELKSIVVQHTNLAATCIFGVRIPLQFFFSFRLNKNNPRNSYTDQ